MSDQKKNNVIKRDVDGILLLDKPKGISSNHALQKVKRLYQAKKAGHGGSLDPLATGMLPICLGEATKFSQLLLDHRKRYQVTAHLGVTTTTGDAEGEVVTRVDSFKIEKPTLHEAINRFIGEITQIPPMYSALKHQGQPLYRLARKGIEVLVKPRQVTIYNMTLLSCTQDTFCCEVDCSKGTYIRTLVEDIGKTLGVGAHVIDLRRLQVGHFNAEQMITLPHLQELKDFRELEAKLLPIDELVKEFPSIHLNDDQALQLYQGKKINFSSSSSYQDLVRLYKGNSGQFIGMGVINGGILSSKRLLNRIYTASA